MSAIAMEVETELGSETSRLGKVLRSAVVEIRSPSGTGSGIIWNGGDLIVTNAHCARPGIALRVEAPDGTSHRGEAFAHARDHDLALVRAPSINGPLLELRDARTLRIGELVFAHGHPLGVRDSLAMGVVHTVVRHPRTGEPRFVVADVRLAPGNSGGPLVDAEGRLLGVNCMVVNGLGFAIPALAAQRFIEQVRTRLVA